MSEISQNKKKHVPFKQILTGVLTSSPLYKGPILSHLYRKKQLLSKHHQEKNHKNICCDDGHGDELDCLLHCPKSRPEIEQKKILINQEANSSKIQKNDATLNLFLELFIRM